MWFPALEFQPSNFVEFSTLYNGEEFNLSQIKYLNDNGHFLTGIQLIFDSGVMSERLQANQTGRWKNYDIDTEKRIKWVQLFVARGLVITKIKFEDEFANNFMEIDFCTNPQCQKLTTGNEWLEILDGYQIIGTRGSSADIKGIGPSLVNFAFLIGPISI